jgi:hypothetical protein
MPGRKSRRVNTRKEKGCTVPPIPLKLMSFSHFFLNPWIRISFPIRFYDPYALAMRVCVCVCARVHMHLMCAKQALYQ